MRVNIYIRKEDQPFWDWAKKEARRTHTSLSSILALFIANAKDGYDYGAKERKRTVALLEY